MKLSPDLHPHILRHSRGHYLADKGTDLRTTSAIGIHAIPCTIPAWRAGASKGYGGRQPAVTADLAGS